MVLTLFLTSFFFYPTNGPEIDYAAELKLANESAEYCMNFFEIMQEHKDKSSTAQGYFGVATMMQAKVYSNPFTKLSYFNQGKKILEDAIVSAPDNMELRFLRYAVQVKVPAILFYTQWIEQDRTALDIYVTKHDDELAGRILEFYQMLDEEGS